MKLPHSPKIFIGKTTWIWKRFLKKISQLLHNPIPPDLGPRLIARPLLPLGDPDPLFPQARLRNPLRMHPRCPPRVAGRDERDLPRPGFDHGDGLPLRHRDHGGLAQAVLAHRRHGPVHLHRRLLRRDEHHGLLPDQPLSRLPHHPGTRDDLPCRLPACTRSPRRPADRNPDRLTRDALPAAARGRGTACRRRKSGRDSSGNNMCPSGQSGGRLNPNESGWMPDRVRHDVLSVWFIPAFAG